METLDGFYFDIETDGLYLQSSKIWYAKFKSLDGKRELALFPHKDKDKLTHSSKPSLVHSMFLRCTKKVWMSELVCSW